MSEVNINPEVSEKSFWFLSSSGCFSAGLNLPEKTPEFT